MSEPTRTKHFFSSYTGRMLIGMLTIHTFLVPLVFIGGFLILRHDYQSQFINNARAQSYLLASLISEDPNPAKIKNLINDQLLAGQVVLAEFKSKDAPTTDDFKEDFFFGEGNDMTYHIVVPVIDPKDHLIGKLRIGFDESQEMEHIKQVYRWGALVGLGFISVSLLFVAFFGHHLTRSVRQLRDSARRIADGNIEEHLVLSTNINEIYDMAVALENMRGKLVAREEEIALHAARQTAVLDTADEGIITLDEECLIQNLNPAAETIFGYRKKELIGTPFSSLLIPGDIERFFSKDGQPLPLSHQELSGVRKSGEEFYLLLSVKEGIVGTTSFFTVMAQDNSERHIFESELEYLATHDTLTDLPNRTLLYDRLQQAITQCVRSKKLAAILFIDLDRFKNINDVFGHAVGDTVLKEVADRLRSCLREVDSVARNGGDEFTVVLPLLNTPGDAAVIAQKIITSLMQPFILKAGEHSPGNQNKEFYIGGSVGISIFPNDGNDVDSLLNKADAAMYQAKTSGGNSYLFHGS